MSERLKVVDRDTRNSVDLASIGQKLVVQDLQTLPWLHKNADDEWVIDLVTETHYFSINGEDAIRLHDAAALKSSELAGQGTPSYFWSLLAEECVRLLDGMIEA